MGAWTMSGLRMKAGSALVAAGLLAMMAPRLKAEEIAKTFPVTGHAKVHAESDDGAIRVSTGDIKQVEVRVTYSGYTLGKDLRVTTTQNGDNVEVIAKSTGHWGWGVRHTQLRIEIHMPKDADLEAIAGDGSIEADMNGNANIKTGDGSIRLQGAKGNIVLHSGDGSIEARGLDGRVDASAGDGHITLEGRFDGLQVKTGDGSVTARALEGSKVNSGWNLRAGDGSIDLMVPGAMQANIDASTSDGHISLDVPVMVEGTFSSSRLSGKMNGGGGSLTVHTGDGSIHLSKS